MLLQLRARLRTAWCPAICSGNSSVMLSRLPGLCYCQVQKLFTYSSLSKQLSQ